MKEDMDFRAIAENRRNVISSYYSNLANNIYKIKDNIIKLIKAIDQDNHIDNLTEINKNLDNVTRDLKAKIKFFNDEIKNPDNEYIF